MTRTECIARIARLAVTAGVSPAEVAADEVELDFIRANSSKVWDRIAELRSAKKDPDEEEEGADSDPDDYEKCSECDGTGMVGEKVCSACKGTGRADYDVDDDEDSPECPDPNNPECPDDDDDESEGENNNYETDRKTPTDDDDSAD